MENIQHNSINNNKIEDIELIEDHDYTIDSLLTSQTNQDQNPIIKETEKKENIKADPELTKENRIQLLNNNEIIIPPDIQEEIKKLSHPLQNLYKEISRNYN